MKKTKTTKIQLEKIKEESNSIKREFINNGIVFFSEIDSEKKLHKLTSYLETIGFQLNDFDYLSEQTNSSSFNNYLNLTQMECPPHIFKAYLKKYPAFYLDIVLEATSKGGELIFINGQTLIDKLLTDFPLEFNALCKKHITFNEETIFSDSVFSKYDNGYKIRWTENCYSEQFEKSPGSVIFDDRIKESLKILEKLIKKHTTTIMTQKNDVYLINNYKCLIGHKAYLGKRLIKRFYQNSAIELK